MEDNGRSWTAEVREEKVAWVFLSALQADDGRPEECQGISGLPKTSEDTVKGDGRSEGYSGDSDGS